jgi:hypothetical protein
LKQSEFDAQKAQMDELNKRIESIEAAKLERLEKQRIAKLELDK